MAETTISPAGLRIIKLLVGNVPQTITELIEATGVTRTAVTEQLNDLVAAGLVERTVERLAGRGRPRHLFAARPSALALARASNQQLVVPTIWRAIEDQGGGDLLRKVLKRVGRSLAEHYSAQITAKDPKERLQRLIQIFEDEGALIELGHHNGHLVIRKRSCPFAAMYDDKRTACTIDLEVMTAIVGRPVRRIASRLDGQPSCLFEVDR
ncbi:MAG: MarR family transcriptional regulator [Thermoguttaceae bacterium]|jgi:predicted ArsR family transcriptional regulator